LLESLMPDPSNVSALYVSLDIGKFPMGIY
jgi:hypothetical protein